MQVKSGTRSEFNIEVYKKKISMDQTSETSMNVDKNAQRTGDKLFTLKKWNAVAMWSWDVECDTCAICRVQVMGMSI